jgi:hypothetical protein
MIVIDAGDQVRRDSSPPRSSTSVSCGSDRHPRQMEAIRSDLSLPPIAFSAAKGRKDTTTRDGFTLLQNAQILFSPSNFIFAFSSDPNRKIFKKSLRRGHRIRTFTFLSPQEILLCIFIIIGVVGPNRKYEGHLKVRHLIRRECNHSFFFNMYISLNFLTHQSMFHSL